MPTTSYSKLLLPANAGPLIQLSNGRPTLRSSIVVFISSLVILGTPIWMVALAYYFYKYVSWENKKYTFAGLLIGYLLWPKKLSVRKWTLWEYWYNYFQIHLILDDPNILSKTTSSAYIFATVPHGIFPFGQAFSLVGKMTEYFNELKPLTIKAAMQVPLVGTLLRSVDAVMAGKEDMRHALVQQKSNLMFVSGGVREMFYSGLNQEVAYLNNRKGFIKLAIEEGINILPVYIFGNSQTYYLWPLFKYLEEFSSKIGISLTPFYGRFPFIWVPNFVKLLYVVAKPIVIQKKINPSQHDIDMIHQEFKDALQHIFLKYRDFYGWKNRKLQFI